MSLQGYEKFGYKNPQHKYNQKLLEQVMDPANKVAGRAMCQRCERLFGHKGTVKHIFTCNDCYASIESERFFVGRIRAGH